jgi:hypothetical protein
MPLNSARQTTALTIAAVVGPQMVPSAFPWHQSATTASPHRLILDQKADRKARIREVRGMFADLPTSSEAFAREKAEEAAWEDR